jgi:hypothetical protein
LCPIGLEMHCNHSSRLAREVSHRQGPEADGPKVSFAWRSLIWRAGHVTLLRPEAF